MFRANKRAEITPTRLRPSERRPVSIASGALILSATLSALIVVCILIAATAVSAGFARAQSLNAMTEPDSGLVLAMLVTAIGVMGALSAVAVRLAGRSRSR